MDLPPIIIVLLVLLAFVALDLAALRFGRDSRHPLDRRRDWW